MTNQNVVRYKPPVVVAEIGCNHRGELSTAVQMVKTAAEFCRVDYVKFQKRSPVELLTPQQYDSPHPNPTNSYGRTYGEHREHLEFDIAQHEHLKDVCDAQGIGYACSVWDMTSAQEIMSLRPDLIKVPSATNQHYELLDLLCSGFEGKIHVSIGMTTRAEEEALVDFFVQRSRVDDLVVYSCTSGYPVTPAETCLLEITRLCQHYDAIADSIGFSGHHLGIALDLAAYTLGATWIERHFTLDRTWKGTDHAASLEPDGLRRLTRDLRAVHEALRYKQDELLEVELPQREKLKWRPAVPE